MKNTKMMKKNYEFKTLFSKGKFYYGEFIYIYIRFTNLNKNKFGIAVSKKQGKSVKRNYIKRLIRENYKEIEKYLPIGTQILVVPNNKKNIEDMNYYNIKENFYSTLKKANIPIEN